MWNAQRLLRLLPDAVFCRDIHVFDEVGSTNRVAREMALSGAPEGTVVLAERQSAGRGRMGRSFSSPPGGGIYISLLFRPSCPPADYALLTPCAGVCVCEALEEVCGVHPTIKWVNDVLLGGKKLCGILTESVLSAEPNRSFVILGIGINANTDVKQFPPEVAQIATSIACETRSETDREVLTAALLTKISELYEMFPQSVPEYHARYLQRLETLGQSVIVLGDQNSTPYTVRGLDSRFGLLIADENGTQKVLNSGEVSIRKM